jgi:predicted Zn-dependent protease
MPMRSLALPDLVIARAFRPATLGLLLGALLSGCASETSVLVPPQRPQGLGQTRPANLAADSEHGRLLAAFGGEYAAPGAKRLVEEIVARLVTAGDNPALSFQVTLLNSPVVNAFALPTGRIYITRGLLALGNDTSEIAAVLAHEIAHVTLRHALRRAEREAENAVVSQVMSDVLQDPGGGAAVRSNGRVSLARFSRQQELEADQIGVRHAARAGFDPYGAVRFLNGLSRATAFRSMMTGQQAAGRGMDILSTHPSTPERVAAVTAAARQIAAPGIGERDAGRWLAAADGIAYGDDPAEGLVRGQRYLNASLRLGFTAPEGYQLESAREMVIGATADGSRALRFDSVQLKPGQTMESLLASGWIEGVEPGPVQNLTVNGMPVVVASGRGADWSFRMAAIQAAGRTFRLIVAAKGSADLEAPMNGVLQSLRNLSASEASAARPMRIGLVAAGAGESVAALAGRMAVSERALDQFLILNGLERTSALAPGQRYKIIVE